MDANERAHESDAPRRDFLRLVSTATMGGGLLAGYGAFAAMAARFLYASPDRPTWQYVTRVGDLPLGETRLYQSPSGEKIVVARQRDGEDAECFLALSSTCPHLGCQVHWEPQNHRFFCPCHNGAFDASGRATEGPPAQAGQSLIRYRLRVERGLLYVELPASALTLTEEI